MLRLGRLPDPSGDGFDLVAAHCPEQAGVSGKISLAEKREMGNEKWERRKTKGGWTAAGSLLRCGERQWSRVL
jgi:hypothetical protein